MKRFIYRCDRCGKLTSYTGMWWHVLVERRKGGCR